MASSFMRSTSRKSTRRGSKRAPSWGSEIRVLQALDQIRQQLPFALRGIDSDNGSEFINAHLHRYCQGQGIRGRNQTNKA